MPAKTTKSNVKNANAVIKAPKSAGADDAANIVTGTVQAEKIIVPRDVVVDEPVVDGCPNGESGFIGAKGTSHGDPGPRTITSVATPKKYAPDDLIPVRSITQGELLMPGKKSGILYRWSAFGDITEVEYQDLYALKMSRSAYVYNPMFVVEDEDVLADPKWKDIVALYDKMYGNEDLWAILSLPLKDFEATLSATPKGLLDAIKIEVANRMENGTFDSIQKIKAVDRICGTDFICLVG